MKTTMTIDEYLKNCRHLLPISSFNQEFYTNILHSLEKPVKIFDKDIVLIGICTPECRNMMVILDKCYIIVDFSLMEYIIELNYISTYNDWERYEYLYYTSAQETELNNGDIDKMFFYISLADEMFSKEKEELIDNSRNVLKVLISQYFMIYHEFFHYQEKQYPHSENYYNLLVEYIKESKSTSSSADIASEVICDTEALIQILHTGIGLEQGFISKNEIFEVSLEALIYLSIVRLLSKCLEDAKSITERIYATFGWINIYLRENETFQDIDFEEIVERARKKVFDFFEHTLFIAKNEKRKKVLIPNLSDVEKMDMIYRLSQKKKGTILRT